MFKRDLSQERKWNALLEDLNDLIGKKPKDLNGVVFLIGVQELGRGNQNFSKEEKQDLMHIGLYAALPSLIGVFGMMPTAMFGIAGVVAETVIDLLEAVEVDHRHRQRRAAGAKLGPVLAQ